MGLISPPDISAAGGPVTLRIGGNLLTSSIVASSMLPNMTFSFGTCALFACPVCTAPPAGLVSASLALLVNEHCRACGVIL
jgi:hypothetical protein